jgi:hypothetical protein
MLSVPYGPLFPSGNPFGLTVPLAGVDHWNLEVATVMKLVCGTLTFSVEPQNFSVLALRYFPMGASGAALIC